MPMVATLDGQEMGGAHVEFTYGCGTAMGSHEWIAYGDYSGSGWGDGVHNSLGMGPRKLRGDGKVQPQWDSDTPGWYGHVNNHDE